MSNSLSALLDDLVAANRILAGLGIVDGFGHISVRHPDRSDRFLLSRSLAPELVTRDDIMTFELDGTPVAGDPRKPYLERFIHGEILRKRPDVNAVVHSHAPSVVPFQARRPGCVRSAIWAAFCETGSRSLKSESASAPPTC